MSAKKSNKFIFDIGSSKISILSCDIKNNISQINYNLLTRMKGMKAGYISELDISSKTIGDAIYRIEKKFKQPIESSSIILSGAKMRSVYVEVNHKIAGSKISSDDIENVISKAVEQIKEYIVFKLPIEFSVDSGPPIKNPVGIVGKTLRCRMHIITADAMAIKNISSIMTKYHIQIERFIPGIFASSFSSLSSQEINNGVILIELGHNTSSFALFYEGKIIYTDYVNIGCEDITIDIAKAFSLNMQSAEKIKVLHSDLNFNKCISSDYEIELDDFEVRYEQIKMSMLHHVVYTRLEEILLLLKDKYEELDLDYMSSSGIVVTGGGSEMKGIHNMVSNIFNKQTRIADLSRLDILRDNAISPLYPYSSALGGCMYIKQTQYESIKKSSKGAVGGILKWIKENF